MYMASPLLLLLPAAGILSAALDGGVPGACEICGQPVILTQLRLALSVNSPFLGIPLPAVSKHGPARASDLCPPLQTCNAASFFIDLQEPVGCTLH
jgi:hypothetical protein